MHGFAPQHEYVTLPDSAVTPQHYWDPQHGWVALPAHVSPPPVAEPHVSGGGTFEAPIAEQEHMRWGRLVAVIVAVAFIALAVANLLNTSPSPRKAAGSGAAVASSQDPLLDDSSTNSMPADGASTSGPPVSTSTAPPVSASPRSSTQRSARTPQIPRRDRNASLTSSAQRSHPASHGLRGVVRGSGTTPAQGLPYTGAPAWIAAVIGCLLLAGGILVQIRAVEIGTTASQYRRGPLLRPLELVARVPIVYYRLARWAGLQSAEGAREQWGRLVEYLTRTPEPYVGHRHGS